LPVQLKPLVSVQETPENVLLWFRRIQSPHAAAASAAVTSATVLHTPAFGQGVRIGALAKTGLKDVGSVGSIAHADQGGTARNIRRRIRRFI
jgi:hypothetical protein